MVRRNDADFRLAVNRALAELYRSPAASERYTTAGSARLASRARNSGLCIFSMGCPNKLG